MQFIPSLFSSSPLSCPSHFFCKMQQTRRPSGPVVDMNMEGGPLLPHISLRQRGHWNRPSIICPKETFLKVQQAMFTKVYKGVEARSAVKLQIKMPGRVLETGRVVTRITTAEAKFMISARDLSIVLVELTKPLELRFDQPIQTEFVQHPTDSHKSSIVLKEGTQITLHMKRMEWKDDIQQSQSPYISWSLVTGDLTWSLIL